MPLIGNALKPLGLTAAASATDAAIHKEMFGSGNETLINSNEEMTDIMKIVKPFGKSGLLIRGVSQAVKNEAKEQKLTSLPFFIVKSLGKSGLLIRGISQVVKNAAKEQKEIFLGTLLGTAVASLLGNRIQVKTQLELVKKQQQRVKDKVRLELARIFNVTSSFN